MSAAHMTHAERTALHEARKDFQVRPTAATAAALLEVALDTWNENHLGDRDYISEVSQVHRWLQTIAGQGLPR